MSASEKAKIKKLLDQNPAVDGEQLAETRALLEQLKREGIAKPRYEIVSPYERKPLRHVGRRSWGPSS